MSAFMETRIKSAAGQQFVVYFTGCEVKMCLCHSDRLAKMINLNIRSGNETFNIPWLMHPLAQEDIVCIFDTDDVDIDGKLSTVTIHGQTLKELFQSSVQNSSNEYNRATAVMYGPVGGTSSSESMQKH